VESCDLGSPQDTRRGSGAGCGHAAGDDRDCQPNRKRRLGGL